MDDWLKGLMENNNNGKNTPFNNDGDSYDGNGAIRL